MKKHLLIIVVLLWTTLSTPLLLTAQFGVPNDIFPTIDTIPLGNNRYRFEIKFPDGSNPLAYQDPPEALSDETIEFLGINLDNVEPQWIYFWEFGDGTFSQDPAPVHQYSEAGQYEVRARLVPAYSRQNAPAILNGRGDTMKIQGNAIATPPPSLFPPGERNRRVVVTPNWQAAKTQDTLTMALSFRATPGNFNKAGEVKFKLPRSGVRPVGAPRINQAGVFYEGQKTEQDSLVLTFTFDPLDTFEEKTVFIDFTIEPTFTTRDTETFDVIGKVLFDGELPKALPQSLLSIATGVYNEENRDKQNNLPSIENGGVELNSAIGINADKVQIQVNTARDPNSIVVTPQLLPPGKATHQLNYTINFENLGKAGVNMVKLRSFLDAQQDELTLQRSGFIIDPVLPLSGPAFPDGQNQPVWTFTNPTGPVVDPGETGFLKYRINTEERRFRIGDKISAQALIIFGADDTLKTSRIFTQVVDNRIRLPWYLGLKFGYNSQFSDFSEGLSAGGFHAGITFRKALGKVATNFRDNARIPTTALPGLWYQGEIMYNNYKILDTASTRALFEYEAIEIVPLSLRYFPNLDLGLIKKGFLGISGGYKASYLLGATAFNQQQSLSGIDFFDRIEHTLFADVTVLNNLGIPGLSIGYRINWRLNAVLESLEEEVGRDITAPYYQLFVHLNI